MEKKSKKSIIIGITVLLLVTVTLLGLTYAYYRTRVIGNEADKSISVTSKKMEVTYEDGTANLSTEGLIEPGFTASKTFFVKNTGSESVTYSVILDEMTNEFMRNQDWQVTLTKNGENVISESDNVYLAVGTHQILLGSETIAAPTDDTESKDTYVLTVTYKNLTEEDQSEDMGSGLSFRVNISEETYTINNAPEGTLLNAIKRNSNISTPVTIPGQAISAAEEAVLASTEDDYGISYYYRGAVENNYVNYSGMCWRIVRVQGDGTIKIVLADEHGECNAETYSKDNKTTAFINDGETYMYSEDYTETGAIYANSYIPEELSTWMESKITDTTALISTDWCNDMSISSTYSYGYDEDGNKIFDEKYATQGGYTDLYYGTHGRLKNTTTASPSLKCNAKGLNDSKAIRYESNIGLLTADEVAFAGGSEGEANRTYYLYTNANANANDGFYWTMSPYYLIDEVGNHDVWGVDSTGSLSNNNVDVDGDSAVRPAVVLQSNVTIAEGGIGTQTNPYEIS